MAAALLLLTQMLDVMRAFEESWKLGNTASFGCSGAGFLLQCA